MKRKAYKRTRNRAKRHFEQWVYLLGLRWWDIEVRWYDNRRDFRTASRAPSRNAAMCVYADWRYATATIYVNVEALARVDDRELEQSIVHELCHALVNEMRKKGIDHEERVVTMLSKAFMWVRELHDAPDTE